MSHFFATQHLWLFHVLTAVFFLWNDLFDWLTKKTIVFFNLFQKSNILGIIAHYFTWFSGCASTSSLAPLGSALLLHALDPWHWFAILRSGVLHHWNRRQLARVLETKAFQVHHHHGHRHVHSWHANDYWGEATSGLKILFILILIFQGGVYVFQLMDFYAASGMSLLWCVFFQTIAICWIFGAQKMYNCIELMVGFKINRYWFICWVFIAPAFMVFVFMFYFIKYTPITYGKDYNYPKWGEALGFMISMSSMLWVPGKTPHFEDSQ